MASLLYEKQPVLITRLQEYRFTPTRALTLSEFRLPFDTQSPAFYHSRVFLRTCDQLRRLVDVYLGGADWHSRLEATLSFVNFLLENMGHASVTPANFRDVLFNSERPPGGLTYYSPIFIGLRPGFSPDVSFTEGLSDAARYVLAEQVGHFYEDVFENFLTSSFSLVLNSRLSSFSSVMGKRLKTMESGSVPLRRLSELLHVPELPNDYCTQIKQLVDTFVHQLPDATLPELFRRKFMERASVPDLQYICAFYAKLTP